MIEQLFPSWHVVHPAYIHAHMLTMGRLSLPFIPLLAPLAARFVQGGIRYARRDR